MVFPRDTTSLMHGFFDHMVALFHRVLLEPVLLGQSLLGQASRVDGFRKAFRGKRFDTGDIVAAVMIFTCIGLALWLLAYMQSRNERRGSYASPWGLFVTLCRAHRLRLSEWWLLYQVARTQQLKDPARLFMEPQRFAPEHLGPSLRARAKQLASLRNRLFIEPVKVVEPTKDDAPPDRSPRQTPQPAPARQTPARQAAAPLPPAASPPALDVPPWPPASMK